MKKPMTGDVFAFPLKTEVKYGLIQIIEKSYAGFNVRVFYNTVDNFSSEEINKIVEGKKFYYLQNFYTHTLLDQSTNYLGNYDIPSHVKMPRYMRTRERKANGKLYWYVFDVIAGKLISTHSSFDERLRELSPVQSWGIEYIKKRWAENFTLEKWDALEDQWYFAYLQEYEPEKLGEKNVVNLKKQSPTVTWKKANRFSTKLICEVDKILSEFVRAISQKNLSDEILRDVLKQFITQLNTLNKSYLFIETEEREEILEFVYWMLHTKGYDDNFDDINALRDW